MGSQELIYHATRDFYSIIKSGAIKSWFNLGGKNEKKILEEYKTICLDLAKSVKQYYAVKNKSLSNYSDEKLAMLVTDKDYGVSEYIKAENLLGIGTEQDFKKDERYQEIIKKNERLGVLIRNCFVHCSSFDFAQEFGNGDEEKVLISIEPKNLEVKNYLSSGDLVWWNIPLNEQTFAEVHTEDPKYVSRILRKFDYNFVDVKKAKFRLPITECYWIQ